MFAYLRPHRRRFGLAVAASSISMGFGASFPWLAGYLKDAANPAVRPASWPAWVTVDTLALLLLGTLMVQAGFTFFTSITFQTVGEKAVAARARAGLRAHPRVADDLLRRAPRGRAFQPALQ